MIERGIQILVIGDTAKRGQTSKLKNNIHWCRWEKEWKKVIEFYITNDILKDIILYDHGNEPRYTFDSKDEKEKNTVDYVAYPTKWKKQ